MKVILTLVSQFFQVGRLMLWFCGLGVTWNLVGDAGR